MLSSASTTQAYFVLRFPILRWVSTLLFIGILQGIAAGIGTFNFLRAAFIVSLSSSSFGSMKNIPLNCLALSSFSLSMAHLCFAFFFAASDICFHISGHTLSGLEVVCFLVSLHPDHVSLLLFGLLAGTLARLRDAPRGDSPFHPKQTLFCGVTFLGPVRSPQHLFSVHDHGRLRSSWRPQHTFHPYVGLTVHRAVSVRRSTTGR